MSAAAEILYDISPDMHFEPADELLIELYLLRRVRGQPDLFPGLIVDDDAAANTQPRELFDRHGRSYAVPAFFFVNDPKGGARPDRRCHGGGTWKSQKREREDSSHEMVVDGERIKWSRHNLNFHMGSGGSMGWVMHEYTVTDHPSIKICRISLSGYGQKRERVPDGYHDDEPVTQRPRVAAEDSGSATSGSGTRTATFDHGFSKAHASEDGELLHNSSDASMLAEMTNWYFEAEQVQMMNTSAPLEPPSSSCSTTTTLSQESGLAQDGADLEPLELLSDDDIAKVLDIIAEPPADGETYQQVPVMDQSSCGVTNIGDPNIVHWEGFDLDLSFF
ncbi:hypothetical protein EJB05_24155, partial [Eragrostis curvula]